jgi:hypothetical protein
MRTSLSTLERQREYAGASDHPELHIIRDPSARGPSVNHLPPLIFLRQDVQPRNRMKFKPGDMADKPSWQAFGGHIE